MTIDDVRKERLTSRLKAMYQAVQDARSFLQARLDDLDGEVYRPEAP